MVLNQFVDVIGCLLTAGGCLVLVDNRIYSVAGRECSADRESTYDEREEAFGCPCTRG